MEDHLSSTPTILVTGANGQLGKELQHLAGKYPNYQFFFTAKEDLPVDDFEKVRKYFQTKKVDFCINCAAYTAVDKAESESAKAYLINASAVANLARVCHQYKTHFIHISTDYVFDGNTAIPYKEDYLKAPINVYGASKLNGEELALNNNPATLIIRTSWVYSTFGNNFVKTMLRLLKEKKSINVVNDQYGCPTYALDIAEVIMKIVARSKHNWIPGVVNYCNDGITNWYDFASAIKAIINSHCLIHPIASSEYQTLAIRPMFSVLDTNKIREVFCVDIPMWKYSLQKCLLTLG